MSKILIVLIGWSLPIGAQDPTLSLDDAVRLALDKNLAIEAAGAAGKAAESRISVARGGRLPKVNYSESWTRSDNPVFVFGSLLTQRQFGIQNFQLGSLNQPDFLTGRHHQRRW
jgi:outer membrane protein TolC